MGPLKVLRGSPLVDNLGWVDVNPKSLQHKKYREQHYLNYSSPVTVYFFCRQCFWYWRLY